MDWVELESPLTQTNYPRRLSLRRGPSGEVAWMLVSQRSGRGRTWEHFGAERVVVRLVNGVPRLYCWSRQRTPLYFREYTYRPAQAAEFLHLMVMRLRPRQGVDTEGGMARLVQAFGEVHPEWKPQIAPWKLLFLRAHLPLYRAFPTLKAEWIPSPLIEGFRRADANPEGLAWWLAGCRGKRTLGLLYQHLVEVLRRPQPHWGQLIHLRMLRGLGATPDQIQQLLEWPDQDDKAGTAFRMTREDLGTIRRLLRRTPVAHRFELVKGNYFWGEPTWSTLAETARWWFRQPRFLQDIAFGGASSLGNLRLLADEVECQRNSRPIQPTQWVRQLAQTPLEPWQIAIPHETRTLALWGREFKNCAARFASPVAAGTTHVIRVSKADQPLYLLEIQGRKLVQFLGHANQPPLPEDREALTRALADHGLLDRLDLVI